jgi:Tfp pilus assembly major pilin PilA
MKNKQSGFGIVGILAIVAVIGLAGVVAFQAYTTITNKNEVKEGDMSILNMPPLIRGVASMGASDPVKYREATGLGESLDKIAENNPCQPTEGRFKQIVLGVTADKTQALIGNSCGSTGVARTFMVKEADTWNSVGSWKDESSRPDFSALTDTPSCKLVNEHNIQKSIAPVCFEVNENGSELFAGDLSGYEYVVR